ncbi:unnamed protein product [Prunus armeniaca]
MVWNREMAGILGLMKKVWKRGSGDKELDKMTNKKGKLWDDLKWGLVHINGHSGLSGISMMN